MDGETQSSERSDARIDLSEVRKDDGQEYLDRDKLDLYPDDGLYSGTAVHGDSEIPGPHDEAGDEESIMEQAREMVDGESPERTMPSQRAPLDEAGRSSD